MQRFSGRKVRAARIIAGLSREQAAEKAAIRPETLGGYERSRCPSGSVLPRLAHALGVEISWFFEDVEEVA